MKFTKMHGAGNDFIIINNMIENIPLDKLPELARELCRPHVSVGADGMMVLLDAKSGGDYAMLFFNSDGSLGEMCGNGARCICRYGYEKGLASEKPRVETTAGLVTGERIDRDNYRIKLNAPSVAEPHCKLELKGAEYDCAYVELGIPGIPHAILVLPGWSGMDREELRSLGRALRHASEFPKGANISFVDVKAANMVDIITFERGVEDFTLACGTGCGAAALSLFLRGICGRMLLLNAPGGQLTVELRQGPESTEEIFLTGPTRTVFEGEIF